MLLKVTSLTHCRVVYQIKLVPVEAVAAVRAFALKDEDVRRDPKKYIQGWGWDHTKWPGQEFPTAVCSSTSFHILYISSCDTSDL
jgi:hypothetical protein